MIRIATLAAAAALLALTAVPAHAEGDTLTLRFETGAHTGKVMIAVFNSEEAYQGGQPVAAAEADASGETAVAVFNNLPAGDYAVRAFHDVNGDGQMNTNPFGMPVEPYAFSNNAVGMMGPASWERARFTVSGDTAQTISIR